MKFYYLVSFVSTLILLQSTVSLGQDLCLNDDFCARKCCPEGELFNANTSQCQTKDETPSGTTNSSPLIICPGGRWSDDVTTDSRPGVECVEHVKEGEAEAVKKALICFDGKEIYSILKSNVPLRKCCSALDAVYNLVDQNCSAANYSGDWPPPVHSIGNITQLNVSPDQIDLTSGLTDCPDGFVPQSSTDFILFEDGSLEIPQKSSKFQSGEYCLENFVSDQVRPTAKFIARFCVRDVCQSNSCVRKCCPEGYLLSDFSCVPSSNQFTVEFSNGAQNSVDVPEESYVIRAGVLPTCPHGETLLIPQENSRDEFFIRPSGMLTVKATNRTFDGYCVDDFLVNDVTERRAVICLDPEPEDAEGLKTTLAVFPYLMLVSAFFLLATVFIAILIPEKYIACHSASLAIAFIGFAVIQLEWKLDEKLGMEACKGFAIAIHFFFLCSFTWLNIISFDIWKVFRFLRPLSFVPNEEKKRRRFIFYSLYAWGVPFIIVVTGQVFDNLPDLNPVAIRPHFGQESCWFPLSNKLPILVYLYIPLALILLANTILLILTAIQIYRIKRDNSTAKPSKKQFFFIAANLFVLMGVSWVTEVITWALDTPRIYALRTDIFNILTGVFLFFTLVRRQEIRCFLTNKFRPILYMFRRGRFTVAKYSNDGPTIPREAGQRRSSSSNSATDQYEMSTIKTSREMLLVI